MSACEFEFVVLGSLYLFCALAIPSKCAELNGLPPKLGSTGWYVMSCPMAGTAAQARMIAPNAKKRSCLVIAPPEAEKVIDTLGRPTGRFPDPFRKLTKSYCARSRFASPLEGNILF